MNPLRKAMQSVFGVSAKPTGAAPKPTARYMRDTGSRVIASRVAPMTMHRDEVRRSWQRAAGLAMDLVQNSGRLKGATDQVLADTVGVGQCRHSGGGELGGTTGASQ